MTLAPFQFPFYRLPHEVRALLAVSQDGINSCHRPLGEPSRHLLVVDLFSTHAKIYLISSMLTSPTQCDIIYLLDGRTDMKKAPKVGDRIKLKPGHRYYPCTGIVTRVWPKRLCLNDQELIDDPDAMPRYGSGQAPESEWQVSMKVDQLPKDWAYVGADTFCPEVSDLERS
jgi:hypothetical protein